MTSAIEIVLASAARHGSRVAIEGGNGSAVTYDELAARVRQRASAIAAGTLVELAAERSIDFVIGCLAAWLAGAAWVPLDPREPAARRAAIRRRLAACRDWVDLAYVIPTSGSSGTPKLVAVSHRGLPALLRAQIDAFALGPGARSLWLHAPIFDASISDWGTALGAGATLVIPAGDATRFREELSRRAITHVDLPPVLLAHLDPVPPELRVVVLGGEPCSAERVRELARRVRVVVVYGPTEATICSSLAVVDPDRWAAPGIGTPLSGVTYRIVDGELHIAGDCLALGYAGDPAETARCFVEQGGVRWYRTGDRVEQRGAELGFLGRLDRQVKLRGRRVELGEIEAQLGSIPGIVAAVVELQASELVARVEGDLDEATIRAALATRLPAWMQPARIVVGALPRTTTGKIARSAEVGARAELATIWCRTLGLETVGAQRFRDAGGDSLAALTFHARCAAVGLALDGDAFSRDPTFDELVTHAGAPRTFSVEECERRALAAILPRRQAPPSPRPAVLITGATGRFGPHLVRAWRAADGRPLVLLVRSARKALHALDDLRDVEIVEGDLAAAQLGVHDSTYRELVDRVGEIVHAAAAMQLGAGWDVHAPTNVDGTAAIAALAAEAGARWHHVSTLSVFASTDRSSGRHTATSNPDPDAIVHGGYAQTKVAAEAIARACGATTIVRLGLLVDDRDATDAPRDQLSMIVRGLARLGCVPALEQALRFDTTNIAYAADATVSIARQPTTQIHHVASERGATAEALFTALAIPTVSVDEWRDQARAGLDDLDIAMAYLALGRIHARSDEERQRFAPYDLFLATGADFGSTPIGVDPGIDLHRFVRGHR